MERKKEREMWVSFYLLTGAFPPAEFCWVSRCDAAASLLPWNLTSASRACSFVKPIPINASMSGHSGWTPSLDPCQDRYWGFRPPTWIPKNPIDQMHQINQSTEHSFTHSINQSNIQSINQSLTHLINQAFNRPIEHSIDQSISKSHQFNDLRSIFDLSWFILSFRSYTIEGFFWKDFTRVC